MFPELILSLCLIAYALFVITELILIGRNLRSLNTHAAEVPSPFTAAIDKERWQQACSYSAEKLVLARIELLFSAAVSVIILTSGILGALEQFLAAMFSSPSAVGVTFLLALSFLSSLGDLPFALYRTFSIEARYGFNRSTLGLWIGDRIKGMIVGLVIGVPLLLMLQWFYLAAGPRWWLYAWAGIITLQLFLVYLHPVVIAPLFNRFTPLEDGPLAEQIARLCERLSFTAKGVQVMDASRRSTHGNAYFTGFGSNKRIVLFDTLLKELSHDGIVAVLAHEIGHKRCGHIIKGMLLSIALTGVALFTLSVLCQIDAIFLAFGLAAPSFHGSLALLSLAGAPFGYFLSPLFSLLSRRFEFQADRFAVDAMDGAAPLREALVALSRQSLSNLVPDRWYAFFHYSHPPLAVRIARMQAYDNSRRTADAP